MEQELIDQLFNSAIKANNEILRGLMIKAVCLRHFRLSEFARTLSEDEADELSYLQEFFSQNNFDYFLDSDDKIHMKHT